MKTFISLAAVMMVTFTFGTAYAIDDQMPGIGTEAVVHSPYDWSATGQAAADQLASYTNDEMPVLSSSSNDIGTVLAREDFGVHGTALADRARKGSAAGGTAKEDENTRIWDTIFNTSRGRDLL